MLITASLLLLVRIILMVWLVTSYGFGALVLAFFAFGAWRFRRTPATS